MEGLAAQEAPARLAGRSAMLQESLQRGRTLVAEADSASRAERSEALQQAACQFESLFISMLMRSMRKTVSENPMFHGGRGEEVFRSFLDDEIAMEMAQTPGGGLGIADLLLEALEKRRVLGRPA